MNRSPLAARPADSLIYLTGSSNRDTRAVAGRRGDLGVLVTPLRPHYLEQAAGYPWWAIDNGVFSKKKAFDPCGFRDLVKRAAASPHRSRCLFVAVPDVVGDPVGTLARWREWRGELRDSGLPLAFVLQDGCEDGECSGTLFDDGIPWGEFDVLFVGGSTDWKTVNGNLPWSRQQKLIALHRRCDELGIPRHMGRVNSWQRCEIASYGLGCKSADGTYIAFGPDKNLPDLIGWLDLANRHHRAAEGANEPARKK